MSRSQKQRRGQGGVRSISHVPEGHHQPAADLLRQVHHQALQQLHHGAVVGVGLVALHHGELGVVLAVDALVAEVAVDLEDLLQAADQQPLQVEFGRDAQVEVHVQRVVVRLKGPGGRPAGDRLHHGRLHLDEAARRA